jgi:hypothetical protein
MQNCLLRALRSPENGSFHKLYTEHITWRNEIVNAVGQSLRALKATGIDRLGTFNALWAPNERVFWNTKFTGIKWARFVTDTDVSCAFVMVTSSCLEFRDGQVRSTCRNPPHSKHMDLVFREKRPINHVESKNSHPRPEKVEEKKSFLETAIVLNHDVSPGGLQPSSASGGKEIQSRDLLSDFLDFGHIGQLRVHSSLNVGRPPVIMQYQSGFASSGKTWVQQNILRRDTKYHQERLDVEKERVRGSKPLQVYIF